MSPCLLTLKRAAPPATHPARVAWPRSVEFRAGGQNVRVTFDEEEGLIVYAGDAPVLRTGARDATAVQRVTAGGHEIAARYRVSSGGSGVLAPAGLEVWVGGVPVRGTLAEPAESHRVHSYAISLLSGAVLYATLLRHTLAGEEPGTPHAAAALGAAALLLLAARGVGRIPRTSLGVGSLVGSIACLVLASGQAVGAWEGGRILWAVLIGGVTCYLWKEFAAALRPQAGHSVTAGSRRRARGARSRNAADQP